MSTKVGFIPVGSRADAAAAGVLPAWSGSAGHSLEPSYVGWQAARSAQILGTAPSLVFVHNPEYRCRPGRMAERILGAFIALERACAAGIIRAYGVATWTGFDSGQLTISMLIQAATRAGGKRHHLRAVQLPVSLVRLRPVAEAIAGHGPLVDAVRAGLEVFCSAPLHGGEIPAMVTPELAALVGPGLTPAQAALTVVASAPGVGRVLVSVSSPVHWGEATSAITGPMLPVSRLREVIGVLGA